MALARSGRLPLFVTHPSQSAKPGRLLRDATDLRVEEPAMPAVPLLIVDGTSLAWRAACGFPARIRSRSGVDITAVFGFFALLRKTHRELVPNAEIVVCFDSETAHNPRREQFAEYKPWTPSTRPHAPFEWHEAICLGLDGLSVRWCEARSYEADDDIATIVTALDGRSAAVMSADHDFIQLVTRRVRLVTPRRMYGVREVMDRFDVHPRQWCDYRALTGDPSDNIPGVRGIGPKRAAYVLHRYRSLEVARVPDNWWGRRITEAHADTLRWRDLVRLRRHQQVELQPTGRCTPELPKAAEVCELLGLWR
jgi:DNA polymerase-1